jgi:phage regulator Rha-like protein
MIAPDETLITFTLTSAHARRLRALLVEEFDRLQWYQSTTPRAHVGYHGMLDDIQSDLHDVYEQIVCARSALLAGVA